MGMIVYSSTDTSAPALGNSNGSLIAVLKACLVDGYGSKAAAGWTRPYTGTNLAAFKQGAGGNNRLLRVFDGGNDSMGFRRIAVRAYEAMTAISTGTGPFPTTTMISGNGPNFAYRSGSSASSALPWKVYANSKFFHLLVDSYPEVPGSQMAYMAFGRFVSYLGGDTYDDVLIASPQGDLGAWTGNAGGNPEIWVARSDTGASGAKVATPICAERGVGEGVGTESTRHTYPDRVRTALVQARVGLLVDGQVRGHVPGLWDVLPGGASIGGGGTVWSGAAGSSLAGRSFELYGPLQNHIFGTAGYAAVETSDTWD